MSESATPSTAMVPVTINLPRSTRDALKYVAEVETAARLQHDATASPVPMYEVARRFVVDGLARLGDDPGWEAKAHRYETQRRAAHERLGLAPPVAQEYAALDSEVEGGA